MVPPLYTTITMLATISLVLTGLLLTSLLLVGYRYWSRSKQPPLSPTEVQALEQRILAIEQDQELGDHQTDEPTTEALRQLLEQSKQLQLLPETSRQRLDQLSQALISSESRRSPLNIERWMLQFTILSEEIKDIQRLELAQNTTDYPLVKRMVELRSDICQDLYQKLDKL